MSKGAELELGCCPPHTLYISMSWELKARSLAWSQAHHASFERALAELGERLVSYVFNGLPLCGGHHRLFGTGCQIAFRAACYGTQIFIHVLDFEGPHDPGPNGGTWQPRATDDRVLGVYFSDGEYSFVSFYGPPLRSPDGETFVDRVDGGVISHAMRIRAATAMFWKWNYKYPGADLNNLETYAQSAASCLSNLNRMPRDAISGERASVRPAFHFGLGIQRGVASSRPDGTPEANLPQAERVLNASSNRTSAAGKSSAACLLKQARSERSAAGLKGYGQRQAAISGQVGSILDAIAELKSQAILEPVRVGRSARRPDAIGKLPTEPSSSPQEFRLPSLDEAPPWSRPGYVNQPLNRAAHALLH